MKPRRLQVFNHESKAYYPSNTRAPRASAEDENMAYWQALLLRRQTNKDFCHGARQVLEK